MKLGPTSQTFICLNQFGIIEASGSDAGRFLHRMSTNHIEQLAIGESCLTTFLNQKARLAAACYVKRVGEESYQLIIPYETSATLLNWLDSYLFAEAVALSDVTCDYALFWTVGGTNVNLSSQLRGPDFVFAKQTKTSCLLLRAQNEADALRTELTGLGYEEIGDSEFESLRIAGRVPFSTKEINPQFHPIQLGLSESIHWSKGCYIGQEVISRLESKDRAQITLQGFHILKEKLAQLQQGESILSNSSPVGTLTSVAPAFLENEANVLAVMKRASGSEIPLITDISNVCLDRKSQAD